MSLSISSTQLSADLEVLKREPALLDAFASPSPAHSGSADAINADSVTAAVESSYTFTKAIRSDVLDRRNDQSLAQIGQHIDQVKTEASALRSAADKL